MKIEAGKSYINARGDVIKLKATYTPYSVVSEEGTIYLSTGMLSIFSQSVDDLICEVVPYFHEQYICDYISQREFIEKHIKHWTEHEQTNL